MPNKNYAKFPSTGGSKGQRGPRRDNVVEKTMKWPDLPGKTQPGNMSAGVKKVKGHAVSKGI